MNPEQNSAEEVVKKWHRKLALELKKSDRTFNRLYEILVDMKLTGVEKQKAYEVLESLRKEYPNEADEELILDIMDVVTGYCSPQNRIW